MASNPELCLSLDEWKAKMARWIDVTLPKALLDAAISLRLPCAARRQHAFAALRDWVSAGCARIPPSCATSPRRRCRAAGARPLRRFRHRGGLINLKLHGVKVFVDAARVYALAHGLQQTNTAERLRAASRTSACATSPPRRTLSTSSRACGCAQKGGPRTASRRTAQPPGTLATCQGGAAARARAAGAARARLPALSHADRHHRHRAHAGRDLPVLAHRAGRARGAAGRRPRDELLLPRAEDPRLPGMAPARWISPKFVVDQHIGWVALFILAVVWLSLAIAKQIVTGIEGS